MKLSLKKIVLINIICIGFAISVSAAGMGGQGDPCGGAFDPCPVPIDGGVSLLLAAGAVYGGKKIYDTVKKNA